MKIAEVAATPAPVHSKPKGWTLQVPYDPQGRTSDRCMAELAADGVVGNARSLVDYSHGTFGELSLTDCVDALKQSAQGLNNGDISGAVTMLSSQAAALNAMFGELARRASLNMGQSLDVAERYMRLALKAQGQCRATLETLATVKKPPVVFAQQANINNGGQQQVNNGATESCAAIPAPACASAHPKEISSKPNELLEDITYGGTKLDARATTTAG